MTARIPTIDRRLEDIRHLDRTYGFEGFPSKSAWLARAGALRQQLRLALGLWPEPPRGPLNPVVTRRAEHAGYTVENVYFESHPGFFVTGNLYRPHPLPKERCPALLVPHGHWKEGRLVNTSPEGDSMPGLCLNIALRGGIAFSYDMIGYNDARQLPHNFGKEDSERLALWGISLMALQTFNSTRAVDFLLSLPEVDPARLACTGASGGGTQTFTLAAIDERIQASAPAVMVSSVMQGGCLCENAPGLRLGTNNQEIAALAAPRPQLLIACTGDWTSNTPAREFPAVQRTYRLFGKSAAARLEYYYQHAGHQYNRHSREALYAWLGKVWFGNSDPSFAKEREFEISVESLRVFQDQKPPPGKDGPALVGYLKEHATAWIAQRRPSDARALKQFRYEVGSILKQVLRAEQPQARGVIAIEKRWRGSSRDAAHLWLSRKGTGDCVHGMLMRPDKQSKKMPLAIAVHGSGAFGLMDLTNGEPGELVAALLAKGLAVLALEVFEATPFTGRRPRVANHDATYNASSLCHRVQDILTAVAWSSGSKQFSRVDLLGVGWGGDWSLLARTQASGVRKTLVTADGIKTNSDEAYLWRASAPGLLLAGGLPAAAALCAPAPLFIHDTRDTFEAQLAMAAYSAADAAANLKIQPEKATSDEQAQWLAE